MEILSRSSVLNPIMDPASTSFSSSSSFPICQLSMRTRARCINTNRIACGRVALRFRKRACGGVRVRSIGSGFSSEGDESFEEDAVGYGEVEMVSGDNFPCLEIALNQSSSNEVSGYLKSETDNPINNVKPEGGGYCSGLFRAPISGGVQSATSCHNLPRPALAVRNLMEQARFALVCSIMSHMHHRGKGYPFGSLVDFVTDPMGHPIFTLSSLAIHTRNLLENPRCSLVVQIPGWSSLSNARVTLFGDIEPLPKDLKEWARKQYKAKHEQFATQQWESLHFYRMRNISDVYFIGGFGTVTWIDVEEYKNTEPDIIAIAGVEKNLKELNSVFSKKLKKLLSTDDIEVDDAAVISIDSKGVDIRVRKGAQFSIQRVSFEAKSPVLTLEEAKAAIWRIVNK